MGNQRLRLTESGDDPIESTNDSGILDERVLLLVFQSINWDPHVLCLMACVSRKLCAVARRVLWRELCVSRAPRMIAGLVNGSPANGRFGGGWDSLAKLLFFCCGCEPSRNFRVDQVTRGHFVKASRFSKTSGQSFLTKKCQGDVLYISDPCEHPVVGGGNEDDLGVYRGVFRGFVKSRTRACLIRRRTEFEQRIRCPYCGARVWSMTTAKLIPKSASRRLGSHDGRLEYFVCVNGHLHGTCWLVRLSSDEEDGGTDIDLDDDIRLRSISGRACSSGEEIGDGLICV